MDDNWVGPALAFAAIGGLGLVVCIAAINRANAEKERRRKIYEKYGETKIAQALIEKTIWAGETAAQVFDSLGAPLDVDQKVLKTKKKEVWKYGQTGTNRYSLKITLDNDIVVGWDQK